jgi:UrcA family protein
LIAAAAIAVSVMATAALFPATSIQVDVSDLDLSSRSGVLTLYNRLQDATMQFCDPSGRTKVLPYYGRPDSGDCFSDMLYTTLAKFENSALLEIHDDLRLEPIIID